MLPYEAPDLRKFIDREGYLTREDIKRGQHAMEKLRAHFPQLTLCTCVAKVPEGVSISEFGFWLFNQSVPNGQRMIDRRIHSILLCIDPTNGEASLTVGYGLDPFIDDDDLTDCLNKIKKPLAVQNYGSALSKLCRALRPVLTRGFEQVSLAYKQFIREERSREIETTPLPQRKQQAHPSATPTPAQPPSYHDTHA